MGISAVVDTTDVEMAVAVEDDVKVDKPQVQHNGNNHNRKVNKQMQTEELKKDVDLDMACMAMVAVDFLGSCWQLWKWQIGDQQQCPLDVDCCHW